jgi:hypothetical protein
MLSFLGSLLLKIIMQPDPSLFIARFGWTGVACLITALLALGFGVYFFLRKLLMTPTKNV